MSANKHPPTHANPPSTATTATLLGLSTLTIMAGATISPALPKIEAIFAHSANAKLLVGLLLTLPGAAIALTAPLAGWFADRAGRRPLLIGAVLLYALAGSSGLWLSALPALLVGRVLLGVASGTVMATTTALIGDLFEGAQRAKLVGWQAAATSFGGVVFLLGGGALADMSWRGPFAVYALALLLLPMAALYLPKTGATKPTTSAAPAQEPTRWLAILLPAVVAAFAGAAFYMIPTRLPFRLAQVGATSGIASGGAIAATVVASGLASLLAGRLGRAIGRPRVVALGLVLLGLGLCGVGLVNAFAPMLAALILVGIGTGINQPTLIGLALDATPAALRGRVSGLMASAMFAGQFASPLISAPIEAASGLAAAYRWIGLACASVGAAYGIWQLVLGPAAQADPSKAST